jgi:hypothetical protein
LGNGVPLVQIASKVPPPVEALATADCAPALNIASVPQASETAPLTEHSLATLAVAPIVDVPLSVPAAITPPAIVKDTRVRASLLKFALITISRYSTLAGRSVVDRDAGFGAAVNQDHPDSP